MDARSSDAPPAPDAPIRLEPTEPESIDLGAARSALAVLLPADRVSLDPAVLAEYAHDDAEWADFAESVAVVFAESVDDVVAVVRFAAASGLSVVPRGAGTGLSGGANASAGAIVLSLERMTRIVEVNPAERYAVAEAGVINDDLRQAVAAVGLWYPPDPASYRISTIGGNAATNAGGICCVKYGVTRDYVLGMRVVLADGSVVDLGRRTAKGVTGYDLTALMIGSEGTLGIIVELILKLLPLAGREERAVVGSFGSLEDAGRAVAAITSAGVVPSALELIDRTCIEAVDAWQHLGLPHGADTMLLATVDEPGAVGAERADAVAALMRDAGALGVERGASPEEVDRLFLARRLAYPSLERLGPVLTEDICVPRSAVPEMLARIQRAAADHDVVIANIAHAGDGNLHPLIIAPEGDDAAKARAKLAFDRIVDDCRALGGTVTGEHGVGLLKLPGAREELGERVLGMHRAIKDALDPRGVLNPGKAFPE
ncbi:FAD-binding protein [Agromyces sp. CFH 90414]|uniref:FAD-binding protein n=1 Tax=Agromyces agglutinans TaxID=2662258 RepID=A0A6I2FB35_9MICO|nr:FAD-linked oxidase C-terminal domain-containing protein [Agromyces agglutinans]MRG59143.1 FAD-binding protein [Agromyces agglutinans]